MSKLPRLAQPSVDRPTLLVDGNNLAMRAITAHLPLSASDGTGTGALVGLANMLSRHVRAYDPRAVVVCWDGGRSVYRTEIHPGYKQSRADQPSHEMAFAPLMEFVSLAGMHQVTWQGYEADDLIAGYWRILTGDVVILSSDKDLLQLVGETPGGGTCVQVRPGAKPAEWDSEVVLANMGCLPEHYPLALALAGDRGDDVDGIPRVGLKTACKALAAADWSLDALMSDEDQRWWLHGELVKRNRMLTDLRSYGPPWLGRLADPPEFVPAATDTTAGTLLAEFLERFDLDDLGRRLEAGTLWSDPQA